MESTPPQASGAAQSAVKYRTMQTVPEEEREWNRLARAENRKCPACGELIRFDEREIFAKRNLCTYCAEMIPEKTE
ncbi:MAG: hypothetical protein LAN63_18380 [Acidobacteriia bacterium]|nr:hypothetical protein [Terriglobia bacterium]